MIRNPEESENDSKNPNTFKLVVLGDSNVGKTSFIKRYPALKTETKTIDSIEFEISTIKFHTKNGEVFFEIWDIVGNESPEQLPGEFFKADCAIIMFDLTERITYKNVPFLHKQFELNNDNQPCVLVGNKIDDESNIRIKHKMITFHRKKNMPYIDVSAKANFQWEKPFEALLRLLYKDQTLVITEKAPLLSHEIVIAGSRVEEIMKNYQNGNKFEVFEDDDDL